MSNHTVALEATVLDATGDDDDDKHMDNVILMVLT